MIEKDNNHIFTTEVTTTFRPAGLHGQTAKIFLDRALEFEEGRYHSSVVSLIFSAITLEAVITKIGETASKRWDEIDRLSARGRISVLHIIFDMEEEEDWGKEPLQTIGWLIQFRNSVVQPKEKTFHNTVLSESPDDILNFDGLNLGWHSECTPQQAKKAYEAISSLSRILHEKVGLITSNASPFGTSISGSGHQAIK